MMSKLSNDITRVPEDVYFAHLRQESEAAKYSREILELSQALEALWEIAEGFDLEGAIVAIVKRLHVLLGVTDGTDKDTD